MLGLGPWDEKKRSTNFGEYYPSLLEYEGAGGKFEYRILLAGDVRLAGVRR